MEKNSKLILFTNSYPYGNGYNWLDSEIDLFCNAFEEVIIFPYSYEGNKIAKTLPEYNNLTLNEPILEHDINYNGIWQLLKIFTIRLFYYLKEFLKERVYSKSYWFKSWVQASYKTEILCKSKVYHSLNKIIDKNSVVLYFYWGNNSSLLVPFLRKSGFTRIFVRFHGFDLYKERLGGYQPFRRPLLSSLTLAIPISEYGAQYLKREYSDINFSSKVLRLGVKDVGRSPISNDGWIRIVSCARIIRLKRIELIPRILKSLPNKYKIEWTHIGDGEYKYLVENELSDLPDNIRIRILGWLPADEIQMHYIINPYDIFISLSESEGIPVSIMEALAAGIPVFTTDVGGISELVNDTNGKLVPNSLKEDELLKELSIFIDYYSVNTDSLRHSAYHQFKKHCNIDLWNTALLKEFNLHDFSFNTKL